MLRLRRHRVPEQEFVLDLGDGKTPERRRADARRAQYEHHKRLLEVHPFTTFHPGGSDKTAS